MTTRRYAFLCALGALLTLAPRPLEAQIRASERARVAQTIDGTTVAIDYARPRAHGRSPLFGGVVHHGETWTPGANWATTIETDRPVTIEGHALPVGSYSMWFVVGPDDWELVLDPEARRFHTDPPEASDSQVRFAVSPRAGDAVEALTFSFPEYSATDMELRMSWGTTYVALSIGVQPSQRRIVTDEEAEPILGSFEMTVILGAPAGQEPLTTPYDVYRADDGSLRVRTTFGPGWPEGMELMLLPRAEGIFVPAIVMDGVLTETIDETFMEFLIEGGRAVSFEFRGDDDALLARGRRIG